MKLVAFFTCLFAGAALAQLPSHPAPEVTHLGNIKNLDWTGQNDVTYFVQYSLDLQSWSYMPVIEPGDGSAIGYSFDSSESKMFLRLHYTDAPTSSPNTDDFDSDGISNWDEVRAGGTGTSPLNSDSDGDGVLDGLDSNPVVNFQSFEDADGDGIPDHLDSEPNNPRGDAPAIAALAGHSDLLAFDMVEGDSVNFLISISNPDGPSAPVPGEIKLMIDGVETSSFVRDLGDGKFAVEWTAQLHANYPQTLLQNLYVEFVDGEGAIAYQNLRAVDVAEWEGKIVAVPFVDGSDPWQFDILTHSGGVHSSTAWVNRSYGTDIVYRGPQLMSVADTNGNVSQIQLGNEAIPYFVISSQGNTPNIVSQSDYASLLTGMHVEQLLYNGSSSSIRFDLPQVGINQTLNSGQSNQQQFGFDGTSLPFSTTASLEYLSSGTWQPFYASTWNLVNVANANTRILRTRGVYNNNAGQLKVHSATNYMQRGVKITSYASGTIDYPGLPQESVTDAYQTKYMFLSPQEWRKIKIDLYPRHEYFTYSNGYRLNLRAGADGVDDPQAGWEVKMMAGGVLTPLTIPADGRIDITSTSNSALYDEIKTSGCLELFVKGGSLVDTRHVVGLDALPKVAGNSPDKMGELDLIPVDIVPDYNRDGIINHEDRGQVTVTNPWRWWINDDDDKEAEERKVEGKDVPLSSIDPKDSDDLKVDGLRDLVDFFPLHLDLSHSLEIFPTSHYKYVLKHEESALKFFEFPAAIIDGSDEAHAPNAHWSHAIRARGFKTEDLKLISDTGEELTSQMLSQAETGNGVVLMEVVKDTDKPLVLEILDKTDNSSVANVKLQLDTAPVEHMYREVNLRDIGVSPDNSQQYITTDTSEPVGYPDSLCNAKYFVLVHGYNVDCYRARGWHAEVFKRMHQMGSRAKFVGVTWYGNPPAPGNFSPPDYHQAVTNAFMAGDQLANRLAFTSGEDTTVAAHSLGNMLVSQAISRSGFNPARYYMINAATPIEAYDPTQELGSDFIDPNDKMSLRMIEDDWKPYHAERPELLASYWNELFVVGDARKKLTWRGLFSTQLPLAEQGKILANTYNFYSRGDEVVENPNLSEEFGTEMLNDLVTGLKWWNDISIGQAFARHAWVGQEIAKGGQHALTPQLFDELHGGWEFHFESGQYFPGAPPLEGYYKWEVNPNGPDFSRLYTAQEAADETDISDADLRAKPFYDPFKYAGLYDNAQGSAVAALPAVRYNLLATAIPASSYAVAPNSVDLLREHPNGDKDFNMQNEFKNEDQYGTVFWKENDPTFGTDWLHSDFRDMAFTYVWPMYEQMIDLGNLEE